ncbi:hypothetical protein J1N35_040436 [Gossypium stocksii]|uniref:Uncharacterized protein n=1 Tax=Gossypium stocksii TaxID=47602 RepID=A0A9D3UE71_9ROSI|nr:hypothetical protein J1N35_040436 [Gossypium stocksii]
MAGELIHLDNKHISVEQMKISPGPFNPLIGEPYATSFWVLFRIILTEVRSRWVGYETQFRTRELIRLK